MSEVAGVLCVIAVIYFLIEVAFRLNDELSPIKFGTLMLALYLIPTMVSIGHSMLETAGASASTLTQMLAIYQASLWFMYLTVGIMILYFIYKVFLFISTFLQERKNGEKKK